jgi:hypothetical protein
MTSDLSLMCLQKGTARRLGLDLSAQATYDQRGDEFIGKAILRDDPPEAVW